MNRPQDVGDVFLDSTWWDVDDDNKLLIHTACGQGFFGDDTRSRHVDTCDEPVTCLDCEGRGEVLDHINYWGKAEPKTCSRCSGTGTVPWFLAVADAS